MSNIETFALPQLSEETAEDNGWQRMADEAIEARLQEQSENFGLDYEEAIDEKVDPSMISQETLEEIHAKHQKIIGRQVFKVFRYARQ